MTVADGVPEPAHGGAQAVQAAARHGVDHLFTLSGAHIFPLYDAAVGGVTAVQSGGTGPMRLIDVRHEQTAVFAAEGIGRLTRTPGFAAVTAGPGVTNVVSPLTGAYLNNAPLVVIGGRAPAYRWGSGALQELDHPPILASVTKAAWTVRSVEDIAASVTHAFALAAAARRGPVFLDIPMDTLFSLTARGHQPTAADAGEPHDAAVDDAGVNEAAISTAAAAISAAHHPVIVLGSDVWQADAVASARELLARTGIPVIANGMGRGVVHPQNPLLVTRARSTAFAQADCVIVIGTPLDFRLNYGAFGPKESPARVVHLVDDAPSTPDQPVATDDAPGPLTIRGPLSHSCLMLADALGSSVRTGATSPWLQWAGLLADEAARVRAADLALLSADSDPIHPARIFGELLPRLPEDAVIIGDGGDFVSFAGKYVEPAHPGRWLDPGPFGCLGTGPGYALAARVAHPSTPVVLLLGDGAAGFSIMDWQTVIRLGGPTVIIIGNNGGWALEKHPMRMLYGYDVITDLPEVDYAGIFVAMGGAAHTVHRPHDIGPTIDKALAWGSPFLVDVRTDSRAAYPRSTLGI